MKWWEEQEPYTPYCFGKYKGVYCMTCDYAVACSRVWESNRPKHGKLWRLARALYSITIGKFIPIAC